MVKENTHTSIWVRKSLLIKLKKEKLCKDESWGSLIDRLTSVNINVNTGVKR